MVKTVVASALRGGGIVRAWSGLIGQSLTQDLAEGFGLQTPGGVIVSKVYPGGPADGAGVRPGDVILGLGGQRVADVESFRYRVATRGLGGTAKLEIWRDRAARTLVLPLRSAPESPPREETHLTGQHPLAGAVIVNLSPALAEELDLPGVWEGVFILKVLRGSPARRLRFQPGDIILAVNREEVARVSGLARALERGVQRWLIRFSRNGRIRQVKFKL